MKWGEHLFGKDYTIGGKTYSKKEVRADNNKAFEYGRNVTITGRARLIADRKKQKAKDRMNRNPDSARLKNKYREASKVAYNLAKEYNADHDRAKQHVKELKRKYGGENVKDLVYKKFGKRYVVNEPVNGKAELAMVAAFDAFNAGMLAVSTVPIALFVSPPTKGQVGRSKYLAERYNVKHKNRSAHTNYALLNQMQNMDTINSQMSMFNQQNMINQINNSMTW